MRLIIVYDNEALSGFERGWGFACLLELRGERILFDAGWDGPRLLRNLRRVGVKASDIASVVLSHAHWDHIGGLPSLQRKDLRVYAPKSFSKRLRGEFAQYYTLQEVSGPQKIVRGVWTTGELGKEIKEQSLVVKTKRGHLVIVGCSHPGVRRILTAAKKFGKVWGILGGLHGFDDYEVLRGLEMVAPSHCTVHKKEIASIFPEKFTLVRAGTEITIE